MKPSESKVPDKVQLVVIAGGDSRRMGGVHKALLPVPPSGRPLIAHIIKRLQPLIESESNHGNVIVVANHDTVSAAVLNDRDLTQKVDIRAVHDLWPGTGSLGGLATGLSFCTNWAIVVACDMPFVNPALFQLMLRYLHDDDGRQAQRWDVVAPLVHGYPQMLHSLYHLRVLPVLRRQMVLKNYKLLDILPALNVRYVTEEEMRPFDPSLQSLTNINTPEEWQKARQILARLR